MFISPQPRLQPEKITAARSSIFAYPVTYNEVNASPASPVRLNFKLEVGNVAQQVEVTIAADTLLAASSASIGEVLTSKRVTDIHQLNQRR